MRPPEALSTHAMLRFTQSKKPEIVSDVTVRTWTVRAPSRRAPS